MKWWQELLTLAVALFVPTVAIWKVLLERMGGEYCPSRQLRFAFWVVTATLLALVTAIYILTRYIE